VGIAAEPPGGNVRANPFSPRLLERVASLAPRRSATAVRISATRAREAIEDIDSALARMDSGAYGVCETCGVPLPYERLEAIPYARLCVACSTQRGDALG
jgi:RNA polymerase-binding transcription factor DksA